MLNGARNTTVRFDPPKFIDCGMANSYLFQGDILHASAFGNHIVVINNVELATELFEKRAQLYSDRPVIPIAEVYVCLSIVHVHDELTR